MNWFYMDEGKQVGPVADEAMQALIKTGVLSANTPVWREGLSDWTTLAQSDLSVVPRTCTQPAPTPLLKKIPELLRRRIISAVVDVACILIFTATYSLIYQHLCSNIPCNEASAWHFHFVAGWLIFSVLWFVLNLTTGYSPGRWLMGIKIERNGVMVRSFWRLFARWAATYLPALLFFFLCYLLALDHTVRSHLGAEFHTNTSPLWSLVVLIALWLVPIWFTRGARSSQDYLSGCTATISPTPSTSLIRHIAATCVIIAAVALHIIDLNVGLFSKWYNAPDGRFSLWIPGNPSVSEHGAEVTAFVNALGGPIHFSIEYRDYPQNIEGQFDYSSFIKDNFPADTLGLSCTAHTNAAGRVFVEGFYTRALPGSYFSEEYHLWAVGSRLYILRVNGNSVDVDFCNSAVALFFESFRAK